MELDAIPQGSILALRRWLRRRSGEVGWRAAIDSLRPHSHGLWQQLGLAQQRRFLRHARPYWDVHRHRIAPQVARQIQDLVASGKLEVVAGRIGDIRAIDGSLQVEIRRRRGEPEARSFALGINCTGRWARSSARAIRCCSSCWTRARRSGPTRHRPRGRRDISRRGKTVGAGAAYQRTVLEIVAVPDIRGRRRRCRGYREGAESMSGDPEDATGRAT